MTASTPATPDSRTELLKAVESHLRSNGDWNINDWREVADVLAAELAATRQALEQLARTDGIDAAWLLARARAGVAGEDTT